MRCQFALRKLSAVSAHPLCQPRLRYPPSTLDAAAARNQRVRGREVAHMRDTVIDRGWGEGW